MTSLAIPPFAVISMLRVGDRVGEYEIRRLLGCGGMGEVYEAYEPTLARTVALKILPEWLANEPGTCERFQNEAATAAQLEHPHIVPIYSWGEADGRFFFTMKLVQGAPLSRFIKCRLLRERQAYGATRTSAEGEEASWGEDGLGVETQMVSTSDVRDDETPPRAAGQDDDAGREDASSEDAGRADAGSADAAADDASTVRGDRQDKGNEAPRAAAAGGSLNQVFADYWRNRYAFAARLGRQLAAALAYAHGRGQIHRDLKPSNIMIDRAGQVCLIDFGLTRAITPDATRHRCGTLRYMSPEQLDLQPLDGRTDIYSLGVTLYETISSQLPFDGADESAIAQQIRDGAVLPLELAVPGIPERLAQCIRRAMHPRAEARYPTAEALAEDLAACEQDVAEAPVSPPAAAKPPAATRALARRAAAILVALAMICASAWYAWSHLQGGAATTDEGHRGAGAIAAGKRPPRPPLPTGAIENSLGMRLMAVRPGEFSMGAAAGEEGATPLELPQHRVHITREFYLGLYEVTQAEYLAVIGRNPGEFTAEKLGVADAGDYPVDSVSWSDAWAFCEKLSVDPKERAAGRRYRLPTEAEWEYACRAGTTGPFCYGDSLSSEQANVNGEQPYGGAPRRINRLQPTPVGSFRPNDFGFYDMHGNLLEWCQDGYRDYTEGEQFDPLAVDDRPNPNRILRGGAYPLPAENSRSARRDPLPPSERNSMFGFRVACDIAKE